MPPTVLKLKCCIVLLYLLTSTSRADEHSHVYAMSEEVVSWMNTVGPYHNRQETYKYFMLPFCKGSQKNINHHHETIGEALQGVELEFSGLQISFKDPVATKDFCQIRMTADRMKALTYAIKHYYWYQMYIDDLPIWGVVGEVASAGDHGEEYFLWTKKKLELGYNGNQIVEVNLTNEVKVKLEVDKVITYSYQVIWKQSKVLYSKRFDKYLDPNFFQHKIHWFSIFNSFMMVIFLVGLVSMILMRTLRKDYVRYSCDEDLDDLERDIGDEYGWKQVHGDVFRPPPYPVLFCSLVGTGYQLSVVALGCITIELFGHLYMQRGTLVGMAIFFYASTSPINGYFGGALFSRFRAKDWIKQMLVGAFLFPSMVCGTVFLINFVAIYYHASRAIPFMTMVSVVCICVFVILPLNLVGVILGRNISGQPDHPCRINTVPKPIPEKKWFMEPFSIMLLGGVLPFGSIFIEVYFIFTSFWQYKIYYVYGFMLLVFLIMMVVTVCVTIVSIYFLLNSEDYRWQWTSFGAGASISIFVYIYSVYYFVFKTKMFGLFQTVFYFSYMGLGSISLGLLCGTVGYVGTSYFVKKIYSTVKVD